MEWLQPIGALITSLIIPFAVNLCSTATCSGERKRVIAAAFSMLGGVAVALTTGAPEPETLVMWAFAVLGGVQAAYTAFKAVGVTDKALDALLSVGIKDKQQDGE